MQIYEVQLWPNGKWDGEPIRKNAQTGLCAGPSRTIPQRPASSRFAADHWRVRWWVELSGVAENSLNRALSEDFWRAKGNH